MGFAILLYILNKDFSYFLRWEPKFIVVVLKFIKISTKSFLFNNAFHQKKIKQAPWSIEARTRNISLPGST